MTQTHIADPSKTTSTLVAALLLAGPVLTLVSELIAPREPRDQVDAENIRHLLDNADRFTMSWGIGMLAAAALAVGYVLVQQRITGRGRIVCTIAAVAGVVGAAGLASHYGSMLTSLDVALYDDSLSGAVAAAMDGRATVIAVPLVVLGVNLAIILVSIAAFRAGLVPWWTIVLGVLAFAGDWSPTNWNTVIQAVFATCVMAMIASGLLARDR